MTSTMKIPEKDMQGILKFKKLKIGIRENYLLDYLSKKQDEQMAIVTQIWNFCNLGKASKIAVVKVWIRPKTVSIPRRKSMKKKTKVQACGTGSRLKASGKTTKVKANLSWMNKSEILSKPDLSFISPRTAKTTTPDMMLTSKSRVGMRRAGMWTRSWNLLCELRT